MAHDNSNDGYYDDNHIKGVPSIIKESLSITDVLDNKLTCENERENVVHVFEHLVHIGRLSVPLQRQDNGIEYDAYHYKDLHIFTLSDEEKRLSPFIRGHLHAVLRLGLENIQPVLDPLLLFFSQIEILAV